MVETSPEKETAVLIGISTQRQDMERTHEYLNELAFLIETAGGIPGRRFTQKLEYADPRTYVGSGKLLEIAAYIKENPTDMAVFDDELSPSQARNIEKELNCRIIDRNVPRFRSRRGPRAASAARRRTWPPATGRSGGRDRD